MSIDRAKFAKSLQQVIKATVFNCGNCQAVAVLAQECLSRLGQPSRLCAGYAGWRVHPNDPAATIVHHPDTSDIYRHTSSLTEVMEPGKSNWFDGHVWLEIDQHIVDFTLFQIPIKMARADAADGRKTLISWKPDYLWIPKTQLLSLKKIINGYQTGAYYQKDLSVMRSLAKNPPSFDDDFVQSIVEAYKLELLGHAVTITGATTGLYEVAQ
jgi:hypothetical protein